MKRLFGVEVLTGNKSELISRAYEMIGKGGAISTVNPEILRASLYNDKLRAALDRSLNIPDGVGIKLALAAKGVNTSVYPGVELGEKLLDIRPVNFGIIGGKRGVAERAAEHLAARHTKATPVLAMDGYSVTVRGAAERISRAEPDIVMVCMGSPKQEIFIDALRARVTKPLFIALGGAADVYSGDKKRAPSFIRKSGFEWAYRMFGEPKRLLRLPSLFDFCTFAFIEAIICRKIDKS